MIYVFIFIFGAIIGSFLNVIILRYHSGESILKGNSRCFSCGKKLKWHELIPVFSFLIQKGRCRGCNSKISLQYPAIETATGMLFLLIFLKFYSYWLLVIGYWLLASLLIIVAVYDLRHKIIPNKIVWLFNVLVLILLFIIHYSSFIFYFLAGLSFFSFFALLWLVSKGRWMGFGDAKLALGLGWFLGAEKTFLAFLFSFWLGAVIGIVLMLLKNKFTMKSQIPFGPFLVAGALLAFFLEINVLNLF